MPLTFTKQKEYVPWLSASSNTATAVHLTVRRHDTIDCQNDNNKSPMESQQQFHRLCVLFIWCLVGLFFFSNSNAVFLTQRPFVCMTSACVLVRVVGITQLSVIV